MPEDSSTLRTAMDRILGAAPGYSAQQTAGQNVKQGGGLSVPSAAASAENTVQLSEKTPFSNVSSNISQEGGVYDPNARSREIQKEQLKFSNFAMEETARQRAADLAYQQQMESLQAQSQANEARNMQEQLNMQNQLKQQMNALSQPIARPQPPPPASQYTPQAVKEAYGQQPGPPTFDPKTWNANPSQQVRMANTQQIYKR
jgi:hypothetical protein